MTLKNLAAQAAMEILNDVTPRVGAGTTLYPGIWEGIVRKAILSAYRSGAEDMRERAASVVIGHYNANPIGSPHAASGMAKRIRALPLTEDDEQGESDEDAQ